MNYTVTENDYPIQDLSEEDRGKVLHTPKDVINLIKHFAEKENEYGLCLSLDGYNKLINIRIVSIGSKIESSFSITEILRVVKREGAKGIIIVHNHPGGTTNPSPLDYDFLTCFQEAGDLVDIHIIDCIIMVGDGFQSMIATKKMEPAKLSKTIDRIHLLLSAIISVTGFMMPVSLAIIALVVLSLAALDPREVLTALVNSGLVHLVLIYPECWAVQTLCKLVQSFLEDA